MEKLNYREQFFFSDIPTQPYPTYLITKSGKLTNFKSIIYPNSTSIKKYTRKKQLRFRSQQAKLFDGIINIGYFDPLTVYREFPIPVQNTYRLEGQYRLYYMLDYYFPELKLAVELDSDYHDNQKKDTDSIRDEYHQKAHGISVFRLRDFQKESVQKTKFKELRELMESIKPVSNPPLIFTNDLCDYLKKKGL